LKARFHRELTHWTHFRRLKKHLIWEREKQSFLLKKNYRLVVHFLIRSHPINQSINECVTIFFLVQYLFVLETPKRLAQSNYRQHHPLIKQKLL